MYDDETGSMSSSSDIRKRPNGGNKTFDQIHAEFHQFQMQDAIENYGDKKKDHDSDEDQWDDEDFDGGDYQAYAEQKLMKRLLQRDEENVSAAAGGLNDQKFWLLVGLVITLLLVILGGVLFLLLTRSQRRHK